MKFEILSLTVCLVMLTTMMMMMFTNDTQGLPKHFNRAPTTKIKVDSDGHWFLDEFNRVRLFHGVNSVEKSFPWYFDYLLDDARLDDLVTFGMNIVRLGTMWPGVEPEDGVFNTTYINILQTIVQKLADRGIYVLLDMHQDVMSSLYGSYDGIPLWLVSSFPDPTNPYPWPLDSINAWAEGYLTQACSEGFQQLYNNTNEALDRWAQFWVVVAQNFGPMPSVIGYNYINEPWVGDFFTDPGLILPGISGRKNLLPAYDVIHAAIRQYDQETIQFYEPITFGVVFEGNASGNGFDRVPGGPVYADVSAYSYHTYCWPMELLGSDATDEEKERAVDQCQRILLPKIFQTQAEDVKRTGGAAMLTEWGLCKTVGDEINVLCEVYLDLADEWLQSWITWEYNGRWYDRDGNRNWENILPNVRPYPYSIAGIPLSMSFDSATLLFHLKFIPDKDIEAPTEIYVPSLRYTNGYVIVPDPPDFDFVVQGDVVSLFYVGDMDDFPDEVEIIIQPTAAAAAKD